LLREKWVVFSEHPEIRSRNLVGKIRGMNKNTFINLISLFFCDYVIRVFSDAEDEAARVFGGVLLLEACAIYGRDQLFAATRLQMYQDRSIQLSAATMMNEAALILNLDTNSSWDMYPWLVIREQMQVTLGGYILLDDWGVLVSKELSRPPRLGGYPDSLA
jgi:hypothetical protein